jgi:hypothetical protein
MTASNSTLLATCQKVSRRRPPFEMNGRPHQSHSLDPPGFFPPQPGQMEESSSGAGGTAGVFYTIPRATWHGSDT